LQLVSDIRYVPTQDDLPSTDLIVKETLKMLDIKTLKSSVEKMRETIVQRNVSGDIDAVIRLHEQMKEIKQKLQELQTERNILASSQQGGAPSKESIEKGKSIKGSVQLLEAELGSVQKQFDNEMLQIPNFYSEDTPTGVDESGNSELSRFLEPKEFDFLPKDHLSLTEQLGIVDFEAGARATGSKFYFLIGDGVKLGRAIENYAIDLLCEFGYTLMQTPDLARVEVQKGSGFNPRGDEDNIYSIENSDLSLIGTSEITIGGYLSGKVFSEKELPLKLAGLSHCFRKEAGSAGKMSKGLYRVHQFSKVEMYQVALPSESNKVIEEIRKQEEKLYQSLELPYRLVSVCAGDLGAPAYKKYDIEAWMPGLGDGGEFGEVTSVSNCTDFQARRLNVRYREDATKKLRFVHTLNGTAVAVTRVMLAILENHQTKNGDIIVPKVLRPYMGGREKISVKN